MRRQSGFTLIELVVVIVVLGILAALAVPRFIALQREARIAVVDSLFSSLRSGSNLVFAKAAVAGVDGVLTSSVDINDAAPGGTVATTFGHPEASVANLGAVLDGLSARFVSTVAGAPPTSTVTMTLDGRANCTVAYTAPTAAGASPAIVRTITGC